MSSFRFSSQVALRYLWSSRSEAFITIISIIAVLGIAIGVAVLNITMAIMTGFEVELRNKVVGSTHILVGRPGGDIANWESVKEALKKIEGVQSIGGYSQQQVLLSNGRRSRGVMVKGVEPGSSLEKELSGYLRDPALISKLYQNAVPVPDGTGEVPVVFIGAQLQRSLGVFTGDAVSLMSPQVSSSPFGLMPRFRRFVVGGVYKSGLAGYEEGLVYTSLSASQKFFKMGSSVSGLEIMVKNVDQAPEVAQKIGEALGGIQSGYYVNDWTRINKELWEALNLEKNVYFIVLLLIIVMASFSIVTTLIMIVLEKRKDIAIIKTMGASSRSVAMIFFIQGSVIGVIGTVCGLLLGYGGALALDAYGFPLPENVFPTSTVPVKLELFNFVVVGIASLIISAISTLYPSWRASLLKPGDVLRYE